MTTATEHRSFLADRDEFIVTLQREAEQRAERPGMVATDSGPELTWVVREREAMWTLVDRLRRQRGLAGVHLDAVMRVETMACGHIDYVEKFALYCAELAHGYRDGTGRHRAAPLNY